MSSPTGLSSSLSCEGWPHLRPTSPPQPRFRRPTAPEAWSKRPTLLLQDVQPIAAAPTKWRAPGRSALQHPCQPEWRQPRRARSPQMMRTQDRRTELKAKQCARACAWRRCGVAAAHQTQAKTEVSPPLPARGPQATTPSHEERSTMACARSTATAQSSCYARSHAHWCRFAVPSSTSTQCWKASSRLLVSSPLRRRRSRTARSRTPTQRMLPRAEFTLFCTNVQLVAQT